MYKYSLIEDAGHPLFIFNTDYNYSVSLSFTNISHKLKSFESIQHIYIIDIDSFTEGITTKRVKDLKIGITISKIINDFINQNPEFLITFLCDDADNKHYLRFKKFKGWAANYGSGNIEVLSFEYPKPNRNKTYLTGVIFNPKFYSSNLITNLSKGQLDYFVNK
ncbi:hypothetical protein ACFQ1R_11635 [Mariniflexile jejuense]|uniref:Uncharacterized protein n=1 Tax=Mariniflexile jejuense TaxID=1173582 RepID=A0ABW3JKD9_9FLAO